MRYRSIQCLPVPLPVAACLVLAWANCCPAITLGMVDDFQSGGIAGWEGLTPVNVADAGPAGAGDNALQATTTGGVGPGSRLVIRNLAPWVGDFTDAGVTRIGADVRNPNVFDLKMRVAIVGPGGNQGMGFGETFVVTNPATVPADNAWHPIVFDILPANFTAIGGTDIDAALADVTEFRILHNPAVEFFGEAISGSFILDNITALGPLVDLAGDYNGNGLVDLLDYTLWRDTLGSTSDLAADGNESDTIDAGDYDVWKTAFGASAAGQLAVSGLATTVPEPATVGLLAFVCFFFGRRRQSSET